MAILSMKLINQFYHNLGSIVLFLPKWDLWVIQTGQYVELIYQFIPTSGHRRPDRNSASYL